MGSRDDNAVHELVDLDNTANQKFNYTEESVSPTNTHARIVTRVARVPRNSVSLMPRYSIRPPDATSIRRPSAMVPVAFMPLNTLDGSIRIKAQQTKTDGKSAKSRFVGDGNVFEPEASRKRKAPPLHAKMQPRPKQPDEPGALQNRLGGLLSVSPERKRTIDIASDNEDSSEAVSENPPSPPKIQSSSSPSNLGSAPMQKAHNDNTKLTLLIQNLTFGQFKSFADYELCVEIMPKTKDSKMMVLKDGKLFEKLEFPTQKAKMTFCTESGDIVIKLPSRHESHGTSSDTLIFQTTEGDTKLISFLQHVGDFIEIKEITNANGMKSSIARFLNTPKRHPLPVHDSNEPEVSPHFKQTPSQPKTYSKKDKADTDAVITNSDELDAFLPADWNSHRMTTRSAISSSSKKSLVDNLDDYDLREDDDRVTRSTRSTKPKLTLGGPLRYKFGNKLVVVTEDDFRKLDDGEFLNDTLIDFYLKYVYDKLRESKPEIANSTYIFNTFFFKSLTQRINGVKGAFENVKKWTSKVDIFSMKYVVIPIHERSHWYVAIIVNLPELAKEKAEDEEAGADDVAELEDVSLDDEESSLGSSGPMTQFLPQPKKGNNSKAATSDEPIIFVFDSLKLNHNAIFRPLREYLIAEAKDKRDIVLERAQIKSKYGYAPIQKNYCDCGVYVAHYVETFLSKPEAFIPLLVDIRNSKKVVESQLDKLWDVPKLVTKREHMQQTILDLKKAAGDQPEPEAEKEVDNDGDGLEDSLMEIDNASMHANKTVAASDDGETSVPAADAEQN